MSKVVTRFAPSPTGFLHIGGARTALFNWLFARHHGGEFLLRIEDTDRARSTPEATDAILDGMSWLGLNHDGEAISQFSRADRHRAAADRMLERGTAYRCYASKEEIDAAREAAKDEPFRSPWRDKDAADAPDLPFTVRLKAPRDGQTNIADAVQGNVSWSNDTMDDLILLRSDGTPTYMLAVVVDDHEMGVTHVIRGDDHLTFAHIPLIHGPDGAKMSKRHGALGVGEYRAMGYLPEAMRNYLARLSWSHGDDEFFSTEQAIEWFGLDGIGKSAARFDFEKLEHLNGQHIRTASDERLLALIDETREAAGKSASTAVQKEALLLAMPALTERAKTMHELLDQAGFLFAERPLSFDEKAAKLLSDEARGILAELTSHLRNTNQWDVQSLEETVKSFAASKDMKLGKIAPSLRAALAGRAVAPGIYDVMLSLGREETLARLEKKGGAFHE